MAESRAWTKERILATYQRAASENAGVPLGQRVFDKIVPTAAWRGKFFVRFSDLVREAGFEPRSRNARHAGDGLLVPLADLVRRLGRFPTEAERRMERRLNGDFPSSTTLRTHFGGPEGMITALKALCVDGSEYDDVLAILDRNQLGVAGAQPSSSKTTGFVYLMKYGSKKYKIGFTNDVGRRGYDLKLLVPEPHRTIHFFETDDPRGIEAYWHNRFADKKCDGTREYFNLSSEDVAAFKRRKKFM